MHQGVLRDRELIHILDGDESKRIPTIPASLYNFAWASIVTTS